jgi:O-antigen ligase
MGIHLPPTLALVLTIAFIVFLFRRDIRQRPNVTAALWLPLLWLLLIGVRSPTQWLSLGGFMQGASMEEGNPLDASIYFILIAAGFYVLNKRQVSLSEIFRENGWLIAFLIYCFIAILWSDFSFIAFKRWIKILGHPIMALILLTEPDPGEAIVRLMKRNAYIFVPLSILFIKYYPDWGRAFDTWTGTAMTCGINSNKNELGWMCMILGFFFFWYLLPTLKIEKSKSRRNELFLIAGFIYMICWLLWKASSATSDISLIIGVTTVVLLGLRVVNKRSIGLYISLAVILFLMAEFVFGIFGHLVALSGHDATVAGRTELWRELLAWHINPIFGAGFESFWLGDRLKQLWAEHWWHPTEAHNGYLETYLNLGLIGIFMLGALIIATARKACRQCLSDFEWARFRLGFLAAVVVFNWTEASFKGLSPVWFIFYIIAVDYSRPLLVAAEQEWEVSVEPEEMDVAFRLDRA